jgi:hypothetical protein
MSETRAREIVEYELAELDFMRERLQATARHPDPDGGPEALAARQERRMRMTGQVEQLIPSRPG